MGRLYADLEGKGFDLIPDWARGTVMRSYTADGVARGGVVELPHEGLAGRSSFSTCEIGELAAEA